MKYIDLHLHLDGAITIDIARKLAALQGILLPKEEDELKKMLTAPADCQSLNEFLDCFTLPSKLLQTKEGLKEAVFLVCENIKSQGVIYAELRFAPQFHTEGGLTQEDAILAAIEGLKKTSLKANLILCCMRGEGNEDKNLETIKLAKKYLVSDGGVVAVDLAGAEAIYKTSDYRDLFIKIKEMGLPYTIHAGEADGAESVKCAIEFGAKRIGHGVRMYEDKEVVKLVRDKGIFLEMCPTSNRQTKAIPDMSAYPLMDYLKEGIRVTVNTDDMGIEDTTLKDEFKYLKNEFGLTSKQEEIIFNNSIEAAFTTDEVKEKLRGTIGDRS